MLMYFHSSSHTNPFMGLVVIVAIAIVGILKAFQGRDFFSLRDPASLRSSDLQALAKKLAFTNFDSSPDYEFPMGWDFLGYLSQGNDRYAFNILEGTYHDQKLFVFDYHFQTGSRDEDTRSYTMLMLIAAAYFPQVLIEPESSEDLFSRVAGLFTNTEIKFESAEFS